MNALRALWGDETASVQAETAILIAFVALAAIGLWQHFGDTAPMPAENTTQALDEQSSTPVRPLVRTPARHMVGRQ